MITGFDSLKPQGPPMPGPMPVGPNRPDLKPTPTYSGAPAQTTVPSGISPSAYGSPGAPSASPLGMWQSWLNTMGPYLAQMPSSEPMAEAGGLSSLSPSSGSPGTLRGYSGPDTPWTGQRGFRMLDR